MRTVPIPITPFEHLAAELAPSPGLIKALLAAHRDDGTGHCQSCTTTPATAPTTWPCRARFDNWPSTPPADRAGCAVSGVVMLVRATAFIDASTHVTLRPPVAETGSWTPVFDGGPRGGEIVLMFAQPDARRVLAALVDGLRAGDAR